MASDAPRAGAARAGLATLLAAALAFGLDQITKWWILGPLDLDRIGIVDVFPPYLRFTMAWNPGANFGLGGELGRDVWIGLALAISLALAIWSTRMRSPLRRMAVGMLIGGALGNALDRVLHGSVVDFLNMSCCGFDNPYAFNVADVFIFAGAAGLILLDASDNQSA